MVGAVVVCGDGVVGEGWHVKVGEPHAEVNALHDAGEAARGADLYVTLEPCCFTGRTGPCTEAIIAAGIRRVVVAADDPNPRVAGGGVARLREAGIEVVEGVLGEASHRLNEVFDHWIMARRPWVELKLAISLDGRIAASDGQSHWITGAPARRRVHERRAAMDGVMVGRRTAALDDPLLTVRDAPAPGGDPIRVLVDSTLRVPADAKLYTTVSAERPVVVATTVDPADPRAIALSNTGVEVWRLPGADGRVDLEALLGRLATREPKPVASLLVEGGGVLAASLVDAGLVCRLRLFIAPILLGGDATAALAGLGLIAPSAAPRWRIEGVAPVGDDIELTAVPA